MLGQQLNSRCVVGFERQNTFARLSCYLGCRRGICNQPPSLSVIRLLFDERLEHLKSLWLLPGFDERIGLLKLRTWIVKHGNVSSAATLLLTVAVTSQSQPIL